MYKLGDVFLTRWIDESRNSSPGYWNHSAILAEVGIVEAVKEDGVVVKNLSNWIKWVNTDGHCVHLRPIYFGTGKMAAQFAPTLIGGKYRTITSIFRHLPVWRIRKGVNCVAVVRISYKHALGFDPKWTTPDGILESGIFKVVGEYSGYSNG